MKESKLGHCGHSAPQKVCSRWAWGECAYSTCDVPVSEKYGVLLGAWKHTAKRALASETKSHTPGVTRLWIGGLPRDHVIPTESKTNPDRTHEVPPEIADMIGSSPFAPPPSLALWEQAVPAISQALRVYRRLWRHLIMQSISWIVMGDGPPCVCSRQQ